MQNLNTAFFLMIVGMLTVFIILLAVIYLGKLLITCVNKYFPEDEQPTAPATPAAASPLTGQIIEAAVKAVTGGKGRVEKIERI